MPLTRVAHSSLFLGFSNDGVVRDKGRHAKRCHLTTHVSIEGHSSIPNDIGSREGETLPMSTPCGF
jgi:hypothetical protein